MHIKTILAGAALALAATIGSASAAEQFSTLEGITAEALTPQEMGVMKGGHTGLKVTTTGTAGTLTPTTLTAAADGLANPFTTGLGDNVPGNSVVNIHLP